MRRTTEAYFASIECNCSLGAAAFQAQGNEPQKSKERCLLTNPHVGKEVDGLFAVVHLGGSMQALYVLIRPATRPMPACARLISAALVGTLFVAGCVTNRTSSNSPSSTAAEIATPPATVPRNVAGTIRLSWDGTSTHAAWSAELLTAVRTHKPGVSPVL